ncbi:DUF4249 domain-containing protein [Flavobacterium sp. AS60]|uniref:DUF4249 family protein n=1 Tax=Flavobacterium anseongense TaxID=2910677 RepID=UPI001F324E2C|nr:DUF4249 family protein [Flavobacterium sp. AS60]MCF6128093.1 DUF4249 domain-containing protein [Flavobacterium sp. AS60]
MKKIILLILIIISFTSCEKVIDVSLATGEPKLVVEASINWYEGTDGSQQKIRLSTTTDYFATEVPPVTDAVVTITNSQGQVFIFVQNTTPGTYVCTDFTPIVNETYTLTILYQGETYTATDNLLDTPQIIRVEQKNDAGFLGNETEVKFFFNDLVNETNHYFIKIDDPYKVIPEYGVIEDRFFQNNEMFSLYYSEDLKPGDTLKCTLNGVTLNYYNYMNILLTQTGTNSAGPFSTPTSTVRGNVVNRTNFDNFALGYFRLSKTSVNEYIIQ